MKNKLLSFVLGFISVQSFAQTWQATNLTNVTYLPVTYESHNNEMYGTVFNGYTATFNKLNSDGKSWSEIALNNSNITVPRFLQSAGTRLYMSDVVSGIMSNVYYSTNGGNTFTIDTAGLPVSYTSAAKGLIIGLHYFNGKIIANVGANGCYLKDTSDVKWKSIDVPTKMNGGTDPIAYFGDTLYAYDNTGTHTLYVSGNYGTSWTVRATDLPADFGTNKFIANSVTGRLIAAGAWNNSTEYGIYYSDNNGVNWTKQNMSAFISKNYTNTQQLVTSLYANGDTYYIGLENNKNSSAPDVIGSTSGLSNLAYDTLGLPKADGGVNPIKFMMHNNKLTLCLNVIDVYMKGTASSEIAELTKNAGIILFPNPGQNNLHISTANNLPFTYFKIMDEQGKTILFDTRKSEIDISGLSKGIYFIQLLSGEQAFETQKFIKD